MGSHFLNSSLPLLIRSYVLTHVMASQVECTSEPLDFGLAIVHFVQWDVSGHDTHRDLNCAVCLGLRCCLAFLFESTPWVAVHGRRMRDTWNRHETHLQLRAKLSSTQPESAGPYSTHLCRNNREMLPGLCSWDSDQ